MNLPGAGGGRDLPALGWDPTPGSPEVVLAVSRQLDELAEQVGQAVGALRDAEPEAFAGETAAVVRDRLAELRPALVTAGRAFTEAADALRVWAGRLSGLQRRADELEHRAARARALAGARLVDLSALDPPPPEVLEARRQVRLVAELAERLGQEYLSAAQPAARALAEAAALAPRPGGLFDRVRALLTSADDAVGGWVREHAAGLRELVSAVAAAAAALQLVASLGVTAPFVAWAVPVLTGAVVLGHSLLAAYAGDSWGNLAVDLAGVAVPGVAVLARARLGTTVPLLGTTTLPGAGAAGRQRASELAVTRSAEVSGHAARLAGAGRGALIRLAPGVVADRTRLWETVEVAAETTASGLDVNTLLTARAAGEARR